MGYTAITEQFYLDANRTYHFKMVHSIELKEVTVTAERVQDVKSSQMSATDMPIEQIKAIPVLFGEADIVKAIQLLPGVQSGNEGSSGMYVRGGGPDENLYLLDGVLVATTRTLIFLSSVSSESPCRAVMTNVFSSHFT